MTKRKNPRKLDDNKIKNIMGMIEHELRSASQKHEPFNSCHEGYGVILEELDELWDEIKKKTKLRDRKLMAMEATQVAAMAARFIMDLLSYEDI
jgi:hypothetical protein